MQKAIRMAAAISLIGMCSAAYAETQAERQACEKDAFNICGAQIPNRDAVFSCMVQNRARLSEPCQKVMANYTHAPKSKEAARATPQTTGQGD